MPRRGEAPVQRSRRAQAEDADDALLNEAIAQNLRLTSAQPAPSCSPAEPDEPEPEPEHSLACAGCGAVKLRSALKKCGRCHKLNLASAAYYCTSDCATAHWPVHLKWHKERVDLVRGQEPRAPVGSRTATETPLTCPYEREIQKALSHLKNLRYSDAAKACRRAIDQDGSRPHAYFHLGSALGLSGDMVGQCQASLDAAERYPEDSSMWAECMAIAFNVFNVDPTPPRPTWWNDEALLSMSARVLAASPKSELVLHMRADVLSSIGNGPGHWLVQRPARRPSSQLFEAAKCYAESARCCMHHAQPLAERLSENAHECARRYIEQRKVEAAKAVFRGASADTDEAARQVAEEIGARIVELNLGRTLGS